MIDLTKLTSAPWRSERRYSNGCEIVPRIHSPKDENRECGWVADLVGAPYLGYESTLVNAEFIALARNAFDVMMRRGWSASIDLHADDARHWCAFDEYGHGINCSLKSGTKEYPLHADPFTALVEADKWYKENVEVGKLCE